MRLHKFVRKYLLKKEKSNGEGELERDRLLTEDIRLDYISKLPSHSNNHAQIQLLHTQSQEVYGYSPTGTDIKEDGA